MQIIDNPVSPFIKKTIADYKKILNRYSIMARRKIENLDSIGIFNYSDIRLQLINLSEKLALETRLFLVEKIIEVNQITIKTYNIHSKENGGLTLTDTEIKDLSKNLASTFLFTLYKGKLLNARISQATFRVNTNINTLLTTLITGNFNGNTVKRMVGLYFNGNYQIEGGTALRWNSRLIISELYRAYQFTSLETFSRLGIKQVEWRNGSNHKTSNFIDDYQGKIYTLSDIPEYPYPCNDSYFIPIY